jgi:hypothetical protein
MAGLSSDELSAWIIEQFDVDAVDRLASAG